MNRLSEEEIREIARFNAEAYYAIKRGMVIVRGRERWVDPVIGERK